MPGSAHRSRDHMPGAIAIHLKVSLAELAHNAWLSPVFRPGVPIGGLHLALGLDRPCASCALQPGQAVVYDGRVIHRGHYRSDVERMTLAASWSL